MNTPQIIATGELKALLESPTPPTLLDVRLSDDYDIAHLPGAISNCVYEVAFHSRLGEDLDRAAPICVYGESANSFESRVAAKKLERAGFAQVLEFRDGLAGWKEAGLGIERDDRSICPPPLPHGPLEIDPGESRIEWVGRNLVNKHWGTIGLKSGSMEFCQGELAGGEFVLDLTDLQCTDLAGTELHDGLIGHLKSDDFFDVERFPEGRFVITSAERIGGPGSPNLRLQGELTLKGITHPLSFDAAAGFTPEGKPAAQAALAFDRTKWNVLYGSGKFFHRLAGHLVNDMIELQLRIVTV